MTGTGGRRRGQGRAGLRAARGQGPCLVMGWHRVEGKMWMMGALWEGCELGGPGAVVSMDPLGPGVQVEERS